MSLIKCNECGKEISDSTKRCPNCGYRIPKKNKLTRKQLFVIGGALLGLLIFAGVSIFVLNYEKSLTVEEKAAVDAINDYKTKLKNPDSMIIKEVRFSYFETDNELQIYMDVCAQNGFGGNTCDIVKYKGGRYIGNDSDMDSSSSWERLLAEIINNQWNELNNDGSRLDTNKIIKKLDK